MWSTIDRKTLPQLTKKCCQQLGGNGCIFDHGYHPHFRGHVDFPYNLPLERPDGSRKVGRFSPMLWSRFGPTCRHIFWQFLATQCGQFLTTFFGSLVATFCATYVTTGYGPLIWAGSFDALAVANLIHRTGAAVYVPCRPLCSIAGCNDTST